MSTIPVGLSLSTNGFARGNHVAAPATYNRSISSPVHNASSTQNLCENCHVRPKFFDGSRTHPYCGRRCAGAVKSTQPLQTSDNCIICQIRPKFSDANRTHDYCGRTCAQKAHLGAGKTNQNIQHINPADSCQIPGCTRQAYKNSYGVAGKYCGLTHKTLAENACLMCRQVAKQGNHHFCGLYCAQKAYINAPKLLEVPENHVTFHSIEAQFKASWRHTNSTCPKVRYIYKIYMDRSSIDKYDAYCASVEARGQFVAKGRSAGNENRRWHGTTRECKLGDQGQILFCSSSSCSLCCIIRTSFDISLCGKKTGGKRFGHGIYTSSTSSKSNDYASNIQSSVSLKAMLLNKVVVGRGFKLAFDDPSLTTPPTGYDSVLAEKGASLNYDELVVYTNDAIRPSYLVMYDAN